MAKKSEPDSVENVPYTKTLASRAVIKIKMSDNMPLEVQEEILKMLPMKPLIQFRSVSKVWKSLIDSSHFIAHYSSPHTHLLVLEDPAYAYPTSDTAILWNISIRKAVVVVVPNVADPKERIYFTHLGFGVCPETVDIKIVKVTQIATWNRTESISCIPWQVEVFTLSTRVWRSPRGNLPRKSIKFGYGHGIDGVFYWLATNRSTINDGFMYKYNLIISFDMVSEEFREITFPNSLVHKSRDNLWFSSLRKSLVLLEHNDEMTNVVVWMMDGGVSNSFAKLFTIHAPHAKILRVREFRKSGEPIVQIMEDPFDPDRIYVSSSLFVYEPNSKRFSELGISARGAHDLFSVHFYMETLLLLDQPEFAVYDKGERYIAKGRPKTEGF
ncbi:F-box protein CPR1-like [Bidens hawaiensis]|uniref:F-box protein CPR1-like n=1 Tax=Bidens hawaiensis TaxID=980011 RepID=UPI00404B355E